MPPHRRLKAPAKNGAVLAEPAFAQLPGLVARNRQILDRSDLRELRALARREVLEMVGSSGFSPDAPLLLAGHQPELSHPGVWVKNFALHGLARKLDGIPLNLVVDNDTLKTTSLRFPVRGRDPAVVHLESVAFDRFDGEEPYEDRRVHDAELFRTFAERAAPLWKNWGVEPLLSRVWQDVVGYPAETIGEKFAGMRRKWEREWDCHNLELPVSRLVKTKAFARFVQQILSDWPRFRESYNRAVQNYRAIHGLRSSSHPVPDLGEDEVPFWGQRGPDGRRGRATMNSVDDPSRLRPRALTLTLFARVCLGDFFIHGIGGGKYDEVTDAIIRDYFGLEPPAYQVLSATLHLPLPAFPTAAAEVAALAKRERDVYWNPQRHVPEPEAERPEVRKLMNLHHELETTEPADRVGRRQRYHTFRDIGEALRPRVAGRLAEAGEWRQRAEQEAAANAALQRRDFAWVLYPEETLRPFLQSFLG